MRKTEEGKKGGTDRLEADFCICMALGITQLKEL